VTYFNKGDISIQIPLTMMRRERWGACTGFHTHDKNVVKY